MKKTVLWVVAGILCVLSIAMQVPDFSPEFQNIFSIIAGTLSALVGTAVLPKIGKPYIKIIAVLVTIFAKLINKRGKHDQRF